MSNIETGSQGEDQAASFLVQKGYKIIARNFRTKLGEIDIVALDQKCVVFVEVKTRKSLEWDPLAAIDSKKQRKLTTLADAFMADHIKFQHFDYRIDCIGILLKKPIEIEHIEDAF